MSNHPPATDQWGRLVAVPCPFCGVIGYQPNGKEMIVFEHFPGCWLLLHNRTYAYTTILPTDEIPSWNNRPDKE